MARRACLIPACLLCLVGTLSMARAAESGSPSLFVAQAQEPSFPSTNQGGQASASTRGLFLSTFLPHIAQGLAGKLLDWFGEKVLSPSGKAEAASGAAKPTMSTTVVDQPQPTAATPPRPNADLHAGIAYEVYLQQLDKTWLPVNPLTNVFSTGQRFVVAYRPNLPGRVEVTNRNPLGQEMTIDSTLVSGGQLVILGPYEFVEPKGDELLRIVLSPCVSPEVPAITRDIVRVNNAQGEGLPFRLSGCGTKSDIAPVGVRSIQKVAMEGSTTFGIDKLSDAEQQSGNVAPRSLVIALQHK